MMIHNNKISDNLISFTSKKLSGKIYPPADKSISHRSLIISSLAVGKSRIENLLESEDVMHMVQALKLLGVKIDKNKKGIWEVFGVGLDGFTEPEYLINCGNSGTLARTLIGAVTGNSIVVTFTGDKSLNERPMERVIIPLEKMGAQIVSTANNRLPLTVKGTTNLLPIKYENPISSAQVKTSVLLAALNVRGVTEFVEPYTSRDHTEIMLKNIGCNINIEELLYKNDISIEKLLFSESHSRYLLVIDKKNIGQVKQFLLKKKTTFAILGKFSGDQIQFKHKSKYLVKFTVDIAQKKYFNTLEELLKNG